MEPGIIIDLVGTLENRSPFVMEVYHAIRRAVGEAFLSRGNQAQLIGFQIGRAHV